MTASQVESDVAAGAEELAPVRKPVDIRNFSQRVLMERIVQNQSEMMSKINLIGAVLSQLVDVIMAPEPEVVETGKKSEPLPETVDEKTEAALDVLYPPESEYNEADLAEACELLATKMSDNTTKLAREVLEAGFEHA